MKVQTCKVRIYYSKDESTGYIDKLIEQLEALVLGKAYLGVEKFIETDRFKECFLYLARFGNMQNKIRISSVLKLKLSNKKKL